MQILSDSLFQYTSKQNQFDTFLLTLVDFSTEFRSCQLTPTPGSYLQTCAIIRHVPSPAAGPTTAFFTPSDVMSLNLLS